MSKQFFLSLLLGALVSSLCAQEQLGIRLDNFSGINATLLNPAGHAATPFSWDVNLLEGAEFISNNYAYLSPFRLGDAFKADDLEFYFGPDLTAEKPLPPGGRKVDFFTDNRPRYAQLNSSVLGPSFYVRIGQQHTLGLITRLRTAGTAQGVTANLAYYQYDSQPFFESFNVSDFKAAMMAWSEIGLHYALQVPQANNTMTLGITLKSTQGYEAIYMHNAQPFQLTKLPGDSLSGSAIDFSFGFTDSNINSDDYKINKNGAGWGLDVGLMFTDGDENGYNWKWGVALLDIGRINFNRNAQQHKVKTPGAVTIGTDVYHAYDQASDLDEVIHLFSEQTLQDSFASLVGNEFAVWLPSALSIQIDRRVAPIAFVNATLVQGFSLGEAAIRRGSLLAVTPRIEHRWFSASLPVSLYQWQHLRLGLALRLAFFTIGTEHLGSIVRKTDFYGTDFYFAIKVNPFSLGGGKDRSKSSSSSRPAKSRRSPGNGKIKCYEF